MATDENPRITALPELFPPAPVNPRFEIAHGNTLPCGSLFRRAYEEPELRLFQVESVAILSAFVDPAEFPRLCRSARRVLIEQSHGWEPARSSESL